MTTLVKGSVSFVVLWLVLVFGQGFGGWLIFRHTPAFPADGPLGAGQAVLVVSAIDAVILTLLASRMRARGWMLGLLLAFLLFGVQSGLSLIEAVVFGQDVRLSSEIVLGSAAASLIRAILAGVAIALLWRRRGGGGDKPLRLSGFVWKVPAIAVLYVACYFLAGSQIAWRSAAVRAFYANVQQIAPAALVTVQLARGLIWAGFAWLLARELGRSAWRTALLTGLAFSGLMVPQLLYPNPAMPWPVRAAHMVEVGVSNLVFGALAALIMLIEARGSGPGRTRPAQPPP